jgi:uncharacterized protein (TIGR01319 family)
VTPSARTTSSRWGWLFDIGSTFTKLTVLDLDAPETRWRGQAPTTVATDVRDGFRAAIAAVHEQEGPRFEDAAFRAASSSAAGGLALVVSGLVRRLSAEAGRIAALGAGAKLVGTWSHRLTPSDLRDLDAARPDIVLLTGGTDGGDRVALMENARALAAWDACPAVIVAGNREVADDATQVLQDAGVRATAVPNILPELDRLEVEPVREAIRQEFLTNIIRAKGIDRVQEHLDVEILPTPGVVLDGVRLLADRRFAHGLMAVEVGGATTNVHSSSTVATNDGVVLRGLPEPELKRTVEGDLGVRWNAATILDLAGEPWFEQHGADDREALAHYLTTVAKAPATLPGTDAERGFDALLATYAAQTAIRRHCGRHREVILPTGPVLLQTGKDLRGIDVVIGTGGAVISAADPSALLADALAADDPFALVPESPHVLVDADYALYAVGLLAPSRPDAGVELAGDALVEAAAHSGA